MLLTAILATDLRGGLGYQGRLPWPTMRRDLQRFKTATGGKGKVCLVGRTTWTGLPPLPGRRLVVASRSLITERPPDLFHGYTLPSALSRCRLLGAEEVVVIGGADVYRQLLPRCDRLLLTVVHGEWPADVRLERPTEGFERLSVETHDPDPHTPARLTFSEWVRKA